MLQITGDRQVAFSSEVLNHPVTFDNEGQRRSLNTALRKNLFIKDEATLFGLERHGTSPIHAEQPVGVGTRTSSILKRPEPGIWPDAIQSLEDRGSVESRKKDTLNLSREEKIFQDLVHKMLAFTVRVSSVDDVPELLEQQTYRVKLMKDILSRIRLPDFGNDRQNLFFPRLAHTGVARGIGKFEKVAKGPSHDIAVLAFDMGFFLGGYSENIRDCSADRRFFCDKQTRHT